MALRWIICLFLLASADAWAGAPVATVRVAFDRDGVTAVRVHGLADKATDREVTADDPVRVASISKMVTTLGIMRLVALFPYPLTRSSHPQTLNSARDADRLKSECVYEQAGRVRAADRSDQPRDKVQRMPRTSSDDHAQRDPH
jgi:hypothetical protein